MWGSHSWGDIIQGDFFPRCMAMENLICDVDENLWPDQQERQDDHQEYFFSWMLFCICGYIVSMKCTVIGQARFHFTCNTFVQKHMYCINTINKYNFFSMYYWLFSTNIRFFYETLISMIDCHGEKYFDQSHDDKNTLYFGGLGQITDTIFRFWSMNEMFWWVTKFCIHAIKFWSSSKQLWHLHTQFRECQDCLKNVPKQLRKTVNEPWPTGHNGTSGPCSHMRYFLNDRVLVGIWRRHGGLCLPIVVFWKYSWAHLVIMPMSVAVLSEGRRPRASSIGLPPCPLRTEISPLSLNILMMLCTVDDEICKAFAHLTLRNVVFKVFHCNEDAEAEWESMCGSLLKAVTTNTYEKAGRGSKPE